MFGLLLRSIQGYVVATFGAAAWGRILRASGQPPEGFEPLLNYEPEVLDQLLAAAAAELDRPGEAILEDVGTFIIAAAGHRSIRRLLRFVGASYADFLMSLEELPDRARLALADLELPALAVEELGGGHYRVTCATGVPALFHVAIGILRAMADDYGALVLIEPELTAAAAGQAAAVLQVRILEASFAEGRRFELAAGE